MCGAAAVARPPARVAIPPASRQKKGNSYRSSLLFRVPAAVLAKFTTPVKDRVLAVVDTIMPLDAGLDVVEVVVSTFLEAPPDENDPMPGPTFKQSSLIQHDGLYFRSKTNIHIYDELKTRDVLFFADSTAVLGGKDIKRESDFLVCTTRRWGILEVMGQPFHSATTAMQDG